MTYGNSNERTMVPTMSPYPTVVIVTSAHHMPYGMDWKWFPGLLWAIFQHLSHTHKHVYQILWPITQLFEYQCYLMLPLKLLCIKDEASKEDDHDSEEEKPEEQLLHGCPQRLDQDLQLWDVPAVSSGQNIDTVTSCTSHLVSLYSWAIRTVRITEMYFYRERLTTSIEGLISAWCEKIFHI